MSPVSPSEEPAAIDTVRGWVQRITPTPTPELRTVTVRGDGRLRAFTAPAELVADLTEQSVIRAKVEIPAGSTAGPDTPPHATSIEVVSRALPLPVDIHDPDLADLDHRHLHIRSDRLRATALFRHAIQKYVREFLDGQGCTLVQTPLLVGASSVSSGGVFSFPYHGDQAACLPQSNWMYADAMVSALERVYTFGPTFRQESEATGNHLVEIWQVSVDLAWADYRELMALEEEMLRQVARSLAAHHGDLYELAGLDGGHLADFERPFARISYAESLAVLRDLGHDLAFGDDFSKADSDALSATFDRPYFVTQFPKELKNFWFPTEETPEGVSVTPTSDLYAHTGHGEIIGGGERTHDVDELLVNLRRKGADLAKFDWLVDLRRYGGVPHAGFSMGFDRLVAMFMGVPDIREAVLFPRVPNSPIRP